MYEANKKLGQNFLVDINIAQTMVESLGVAEGDEVIEIGPGLGALTDFLGKLTHLVKFNLTAVDIDKRFTSKLESMFAEKPTVFIVNEDILRFLPHFESDKDIKIVGSLPFYITSPILHAMIKMKKQPSRIVIMIQKEVAKKIINDAPDGSYLSVFTQTFFNVTRVVEVPRTKFKPEPDVDATVISLTKNDVFMSPEKIEKYEGFLHKVFKNPRKMLNKALSQDELKKGEVGPSLRPQEVSAQKWLDFFQKVCS